MLYFLYAISLLGFLILSILILRYTIRHGHLAPRFKWAVTIFGLIALLTISASVYFILQVGESHSNSIVSPSPRNEINTVSGGDLNF